GGDEEAGDQPQGRARPRPRPRPRAHLRPHQGVCRHQRRLSIVGRNRFIAPSAPPSGVIQGAWPSGAIKRLRPTVLSMLVSLKTVLVAACALIDADGRVLLAQRPPGK